VGFDGSPSAGGRAGDITLTAGQSISLTNGSVISAITSGKVDAGTITLNAGKVFTSQNSAVTTQANQTNGGNITVLASDLVSLQNSQITTSTTGATNNGGNILIDPVAVALQNSHIRANAVGGHGGAISILNTQVILSDADSSITAVATSGVNGQINIQAPFQQLSGAIAPLPQAFAVASNLYGQRCAAQKGGQFSSFVQGARDGIPPEPGNLIPSPIGFNFYESATAYTTERESAVSGLTHTVLLSAVGQPSGILDATPRSAFLHPSDRVPVVFASDACR
jgi:large exoprotein involved in heme utilization and adhesion